MSQSPRKMASKWERPRLFRLAHNEAFSQENVVKGFQSRGIYLVNRSKIPSSAFAHSRSFDIGRVNEASKSIVLTLVKHMAVIAHVTSESSQSEL